VRSPEDKRRHLRWLLALDPSRNVRPCRPLTKFHAALAEYDCRPRLRHADCAVKQPLNILGYQLPASTLVSRTVHYRDLENTEVESSGIGVNSTLRSTSYRDVTTKIRGTRLWHHEMQYQICR
jgi:hypothetical protein